MTDRALFVIYWHAPRARFVASRGRYSSRRAFARARSVSLDLVVADHETRPMADALASLFNMDAQACSRMHALCARRARIFVRKALSRGIA